MLASDTETNAVELYEKERDCARRRVRLMARLAFDPSPDGSRATLPLSNETKGMLEFKPANAFTGDGTDPAQQKGLREIFERLQANADADLG